MTDDRPQPCIPDLGQILIELDDLIAGLRKDQFQPQVRLMIEGIRQFILRCP